MFDAGASPLGTSGSALAEVRTVNEYSVAAKASAMDRRVIEDFISHSPYRARSPGSHEPIKDLTSPMIMRVLDYFVKLLKPRIYLLKSLLADRVKE